MGRNNLGLTPQYQKDIQKKSNEKLKALDINEYNRKRNEYVRKYRQRQQVITDWVNSIEWMANIDI